MSFVFIMRTIPTRVGRTSELGTRNQRNSDHPHAGGENLAFALDQQALPGPSPRGWGEHWFKTGGSISPRTIPTRVGRTKRLVVNVPVGPDHPHAGGENQPRQSGVLSLRGPSPRGWGERKMILLIMTPMRTIPTRVGRTRPPHRARLGRTDHPHAGGENASASPRPPWSNGPSPRGWGEHNMSYKTPCEQRTIPTRVGRTRQRETVQSPNADHPHAGGENCTERH